MHLVWAFLSEHCTHRVKGTFSTMHVIIHSRRFMCMRRRLEKVQRKMGCTSLINLEQRQSKTVGCQVVKLNPSKQEVDIPLNVAEDAV